SLNLGSDTIVQTANANHDTLDFTGLGQPFLLSSTGINLNLALTSTQTVVGGVNGPNLRLTLSGGTAIEEVDGSPFDDVIRSNAAGDTISGNAGDDQIFGGAGNDYLDGGAGNDTIVSIGGGVDMVHGGAGQDSLWVDKTDLTDYSLAGDGAHHLHAVDNFVS